MEDYTERPSQSPQACRLIVTVTILNPDGSVTQEGHPLADPSVWAVKCCQESTRAGVHPAIREALRQASLRLSGSSGPGEQGTGLSESQSDWERLIDVRLQSQVGHLYSEALTVMERQLLTRVLNYAGGNQTQAAQILGITRGSLRAKIRTLGIVIDHAVRSDNDQLDRLATRKTVAESTVP